MTMDRKIHGKYTADYLTEKGILPILKVDKGLAAEVDGVRLMKPINGLDALLERAKERHIFGTKMRSVISSYNEKGIHEIVKQQFAYGIQIAKAGFVPDSGAGGRHPQPGEGEDRVVPESRDR